MPWTHAPSCGATQRLGDSSSLCNRLRMHRLHRPAMWTLYHRKYQKHKPHDEQSPRCRGYPMRRPGDDPENEEDQKCPECRHKDLLSIEICSTRTKAASTHLQLTELSPWRCRARSHRFHYNPFTSLCLPLRTEHFSCQPRELRPEAKVSVRRHRGVPPARVPNHRAAHARGAPRLLDRPVHLRGANGGTGRKRRRKSAPRCIT